MRDMEISHLNEQLEQAKDDFNPNKALIERA
jgi:hypothetical protein